MKRNIYIGIAGLLLVVGGYLLGSYHLPQRVRLAHISDRYEPMGGVTMPSVTLQNDTIKVQLLYEDLVKLSFRIDSLCMVRTQHDLAMEKADDKFDRTINLLNLILAIIAVGGTGIGFYVSRVVNKFDKRLERIAGAESELELLVRQAGEIKRQLPALVAVYANKIERVKEETERLTKTRADAEQELVELKSKYDVDVTSLEERLKQASNPQLDEINAKMRELEGLGGKLTAEDYTNRSFSLNKKGLNVSAVAAAESALEIDDKYPQGWLSRAFALEDLGLLSETINAYDHYLQLEPNSPGGHFLIGVVLSKNKDEKRASEMLDRAATLYYERACSRALAGEHVAALDDLESAIKRDSSYKKMAQSEARFSPLKDNPRFIDLVND